MAYIDVRDISLLTLEEPNLADIFFTTTGKGNKPAWKSHRHKVEYVRRAWSTSSDGYKKELYVVRYADGWLSPVGDKITISDSKDCIYNDIKDAVSERCWARNM